MKKRKITKSEQVCIANCIYRYWGNRDSLDSDEKRDRQYEQCLSDCRICG